MHATIRSTRLIFIEGIMGAGKSTAARFLAEYLQQNQIEVQFIPEGGQGHPVRLANNLPHPRQPWEDVTVDEFITQSLEKWRAYVAAMQPLATVSIFDGQLFHGNLTDLLLMDCPQAMLEEYVNQVIQTIAPLQPVVINFYQDDVAQALRATHEQRGDEWIAYQVNWKLQSPYTKRHSLAGQEGLVALYRTYRNLCNELLAQMALPQLHIDNTTSNWTTHYQAIIKFLQLPTATGQDSAAKAQLLATLTTELDLFETLVMNHPQERLVEPGACGQWSVKDTMAHLAAWNQRIFTVVTQAYQAGNYNSLMQQDEDWATTVARLNQATYDTHKYDSWGSVALAYRASIEQLVAFITTCSKHELSPLSPIRPVRMSMGDVIERFVCQHIEKHRLVLEQWLRARMEA